MTTYVARAVPWRAVTAVGLILVLLLAALSFQVARLWPLEGCGLGLLAGATAWCFDEPNAAIVDVAPRTLAWRTVTRAAGVGWLIAWWLLGIAATRAAFHGHAVAVALHGLAAALAVTATVTWRRAAGTPVPGTTTAAIVTPVAVFLALGRPYPHTIALFPYVYGGPWDLAAVWWVSTAGLASLLLLVTLMDIRSIGNRARRPRDMPTQTARV